MLAAYKDAALQAASPWLPTTSAAAAGGQAAELAAALLQCARNSGHGQGGIVQPMVALAVALIEAGASSSGGFGGTKSGGATAALLPLQGGGGGDESAAVAATPAQRAAALGSRLLLELFEAHRDFRTDIIRLCHARLIGAKVGARQWGMCKGCAALFAGRSCTSPAGLPDQPCPPGLPPAGRGGGALHPPAGAAGAPQPGHHRRCGAGCR